MLVTRVRIFCTTLFTNNNIKVVIQKHIILMEPSEKNQLWFEKETLTNPKKRAGIVLTVSMINIFHGNIFYS